MRDDISDVKSTMDVLKVYNIKVLGNLKEKSTIRQVLFL